MKMSKNNLKYFFQFLKSLVILLKGLLDAYFYMVLSSILITLIEQIILPENSSLLFWKSVYHNFLTLKTLFLAILIRLIVVMARYD